MISNDETQEARANPISSKQGGRDLQSWATLFEPDILASAQYQARWLRRRYPDPEKMLMLAVLEDAVTCFQKWASASSAIGKNHFREVEHWIMNEKSDWLFSFKNICEVLDLDPSYIRAGLNRWREDGKSQRSNYRLFYIVRAGRRTRKRDRVEAKKPNKNRSGPRFGISAYTGG